MLKILYDWIHCIKQMEKGVRAPNLSNKALNNPPFSVTILNLIQSLLQVIKNIVDVLCSDTQSDCRRCDVLLSQLFWWQLWVSCCVWMDHKALNVCNVCKKREDFQWVDKLPCLVLSALDLEYEISKLAVDPSAQGKGVAKQLFDAIFNYAKNNNISKLILETNTKLKAAMGLYNKYGFSEVKDFTPHYTRVNIKFEKLLSWHKKS